MYRLNRSRSAASQRSPYFRQTAKTATPAAPSRSIAHTGIVSTEPPNAQATRRPQGRVSSTIRKKRCSGMSVSPARMQIRSSGKKGKRKTRIKKISRFLRITSRYLSATRWLTSRSTNRCPSTRASQNTRTEPPATANQVIRNEGHIPKSTAPASAVTLLGMGAITTESS